MTFSPLKNFTQAALIAFALAQGIAWAATDKIALVIGNSKYESLGTLSNTISDAKGIDKALRELGYKSKLVIDATDSQIRKEVKKFSSETDGASIAVLFYAGHGAQVNGENYLLPIDMDAPQRDSDIQISGFKVDDILNSMKSTTKVVFLDACRDNPALMKSMVKGRGAYRGGLAPANTSNIDASNGVFIAYSTDAGNIAADGEGQSNSPFTTALLKHIKEPISIDDMFSKVTKDVKSSTGSKQKPYKYASLDNIICLPGFCSKGAGVVDAQQLKPAQNTEAKTPISPTTIVTPTNPYLPLTSIEDWLIFESQAARNNQPVYLKPSSWGRVDGRAVIEIKWTDPNDFAPDVPQKSSIKYGVLGYAIDCSSKKAGLTEAVFYDKSNKEVTRNKWGSPSFVPLNIEHSVKESIGYLFFAYACSGFPTSSVVSKSAVTSPEFWEALYDIDNNKTLYILRGSRKREGNIGAVTTKVDLKTPANFDESFPVFKGVGGLPQIKTTVYQNQVDCAKRTLFTKSVVVYSPNGAPVGIQPTWIEENIKPVPVTSELEQLYNVACQR